MRRHTPLAAAGLAAALALTLAGCFAAPPTSPPTAESPAATEQAAPPPLAADPATGDLITGRDNGYTFTAPQGWVVPPDAPPAADAFAVSPADADGFFTTVNVLLAPALDDSLDLREIRSVEYLESIGGTDVQVRPRVAVDGTESVHISAARTSNGGLDYRSEQYVATHDGLDYTITFIVSQAVPQADREALAESVLVTWAWAD